MKIITWHFVRDLVRDIAAYLCTKIIYFLSSEFLCVAVDRSGKFLLLSSLHAASRVSLLIWCFSDAYILVCDKIVVVLFVFTFQWASCVDFKYFNTCTTKFDSASNNMSNFDERSGVVACETAWGQWYQTIEEVYIEINVPQGTIAKQINIIFAPTQLTCVVRGESIIKVRWVFQWKVRFWYQKKAQMFVIYIEILSPKYVSFGLLWTKTKGSPMTPRVPTVLGQRKTHFCWMYENHWTEVISL